MSGALLFKRDPTDISDEERERLRAEMDRFKGAERRRQLRAVVAVLAAIGVTLAVAGPTVAILLFLFHVDLKGFVYFSLAPSLAAGGWVYRKLYPRDFWGR